MALDAGDVLVDGILYVGLIHMHGNLLTVHHLINRLLRVTFQTDPVRETSRNAFLAHFVREMAVRTGGNRPRLLFPHFAADHLRVDFLDLAVANLARLGDVIG